VHVAIGVRGGHGNVDAPSRRRRAHRAHPLTSIPEHCIAVCLGPTIGGA
jgi:hypothetical protein